MTAPPETVQLVERFRENLAAYRSPSYNETQLRREFLDPFFRVLGWDVDNSQGFAEAYKDVVHEDAVKVGGFTKAPDYSFRIGGTRKFFVEAKKPAINIKNDPEPAFQLRRYAWSAKLPVSILSDFEQFAVYDCRIRPNPGDKASVARIMLLDFEHYLDRWDEIASVFSKEAIQKGSFDKFAEGAKGKRGTAEVDTAFLKEIEGWRELLAKNIALRNPNLTQRELNFAVQRTIDRIVFLRICEARGIEDDGMLRGQTNGTQVYPRLVEQFERADQRYNSGLFHFRDESGQAEEPDRLTPTLTIDDKVIKEIIGDLYYPRSPYEFAVLPADILGQVYEQFLGKVIRLTAGHQAKVEEKPEVRKAGGVYYTPTHIVDYIVDNTVGKLLEAKTPKQADKLRILDPACGSGSFLIVAYQRLLDWYLERYSADAAKFKKLIFQGPGGEWRLTTAERKRILLNNIYGVDIDPQAVEVTKLSLALKVLEGETAETLGKNLQLFRERALPDLGGNIKCGNSLIGSDFYEQQQMLFLDEEEAYRINMFDWNHAFRKTICEEGGFDAILGNPPWGAEIHKTEREYLGCAYPAVADFESSQYMLVRSLSLLKLRGILGMIIPNTFVLNVYARRCRQAVLKAAGVSSIVDLSEQEVFSGPSVRAVILQLRQGYEGDCEVLLMADSSALPECVNMTGQESLRDAETWKRFLSRQSELTGVLDNLLDSCPPLSTYCDVRQGYIPYRTSTLTSRLGHEDAVRIVKNREWHATSALTPEYVRELQGADVGRYFLRWSGTWVRYGPWVSTYLPMSVFSGPRVLVREIAGKTPRLLLCTYTDEEFVHNPGVLAVLPHPSGVSPKFIVGVLNSLLLSQVFAYVAPKAKKGLFPKIIITDARRLPFPVIDLDNAEDRSAHDLMVRMVEQRMALEAKLYASRAPQERTAIESRIDALETKIEDLVCEMFGLSGDQVRTVKDSSQGY